MCETPSKPVNTGRERAKFRNAGSAQLSLVVWLWTELEGGLFLSVWVQFKASASGLRAQRGRAALLLMPDA